jgi:hypothetical protein
MCDRKEKNDVNLVNWEEITSNALRIGFFPHTLYTIEKHVFK